MNTRHGTLAILAVLSLATAGNLFAQRRGSSGGGSSGRSAPSGGSSAGRSSGGSRGSSSGSSTRGRSSGGSSTATKRGGSSTASQPSTRGQAADGSQASGTRGTPLPTTGKIGAIKRNARTVTAATHTGGGVYYGGGVYVGGCWNCGYWGYYGPAWGWYDNGWWYPARYPYDAHREYHDQGAEPDVMPEEPVAPESDVAPVAQVRGGQGYMAYPYGEDNGDGETFVLSRTSERRSYGALTASYFQDKGSTTQAGHLTLEGGIKAFHYDLGYDHYAEPVQGGTDRLQSGRISLGAQLPMGRHAYMIAGVGARGVWLNDKQDAYGPEGTLGLQLLPFRPIGLSVTGRLAQMSWTGQDWFTMTEVNATGSVFLWHLELQGGWHWMQMEGSPAFGGPMVGTKIWF